MLANAVQALPPDKLNPLFGMLRQSIGSDDAYNAVMQQIAPDAPLKAHAGQLAVLPVRSEEHTSELQSLMRISYAVFCLNKKKNNRQIITYRIQTIHISIETK